MHLCVFQWRSLRGRHAARQETRRRQGQDTGETHEGQFAHGKRQGFGMQRRRDGTITDCGRWLFDQFYLPSPVPRAALPAGSMPHDHDALLFPDGRTFRGPLNAQNQPHGHGNMRREDGSEESCGDWLNGSLTGLGLLRMPDGDVFEGQFVAGKRKGFGILWNADGKLLKCGEWGSGWLWELNSRPVPRRFIPFGGPLSGAVSVFYPSGEYFVGPLNAQDQPHGVGEMHATDDSIKQIGVWKDGQFVSGARSPPAAAAVCKNGQFVR